MAKKAPINQETGIMLVITYFIIFVVNALVILIANVLFPEYIVLGTATITKTWAILYSVTALTLLNTFSIPFIREYENRTGKMLKSSRWMIKYFLINFIGLWLISRFAEELGLGLSSWMVAVVLAVVLDVVQGMVMMQVEKFRS